MIYRICSVNFRKQFVFKQLNFIMRKLPKAFSYSDYLSKRWMHPLWAIKPIDYLTWLLKPYSLRILSDWYMPPSPRMYYWRIISWYCSSSGKYCSLNKHEEIIQRRTIVYLEASSFSWQLLTIPTPVPKLTPPAKTWIHWRTINNFVSSNFLRV